MSDADRGLVAGQLKKAHAEGRLDLTEFDERTRQVWAARTFGDLAGITADLPDIRQPVPWSRSELAPEQPKRGGEVARRASGPGAAVMKVATTAWFAASLVNFVVWGLVSLTSGNVVYPWWIWVAGPWGALLIAGYVTGVGRDHRD